MFAFTIDNVVRFCKVPNQAIRLGVQYIETDELPQDPWHEAFEIAGNEVVSNIPKLKEWAHGRRRAKRMEEFAPHDDTIKLAIPGQDAVAAEAARANIRTKDSQRQAAIDACTTEAELRTVIETENL